MILCRYRGNWYLSTGITKDRKQCGLRCSPLMPHPQGFKPLPPVGAVLYGAVSELDEITFYPEIRCRLGYPVLPKNWHREREEPILRCYLQVHIISEQITEFDDLTKRSREYKQRIAALEANGWEWPDPREGCEKYIHVDELTKIEGPPPEGAF